MLVNRLLDAALVVDSKINCLELNMKQLSILAVCVAAFSVDVALAAPGIENAQERNVNQQQRIEQGLKSGELSTREAGKLEREQAQVERTEARAMRDGTVSATEQKRINALENRASRDIYRQKHDAQTGNPNSASSQRMQRDVQRNVNQQERIQAGIDNGSLTNREAARMERGQARVTGREARAAADGHVGAGEQAGIRRAENRQSRRIYRNKHD